jgi:hypothetical protein
MKTKVTVRADEVLVKTPYKNGFVIWSLESIHDVWDYNLGLDSYSYTHVWRLYSKKKEYNPERVERWHSEFLYGHNLMSMIHRTAAAKHNYDLLNLLPNIEIYPYPLV